MSLLLGSRRSLLGMLVSPLLVADEFTTDVAGGSVPGTPAEPGPGPRVGLDGNAKMSISGGNLVVVTGGVGNGDPSHYLQPILRVAARGVISSLTYTSAVGFQIGFDDNTGSTIANNINGSGTSLRVRVSDVANITVGAIVAGGVYQLVVLLRTTGVYLFIKGGTFTNWTLIWVDLAGSTNLLNPGISANSSSNAWTAAYLRVYNFSWLPAPLASDGFVNTFGLTDGKGHPEGISGGFGSGGGNVTITQQVGTWQTSGGVANASALAGGIAFFTTDLGTKDVIATIRVTRGSGSGGLLLRYTDANNRLYAEYDGTNCYLKQVLAGVTTTITTGVATYVANAIIMVILDGTAARLYYNGVQIGTGSVNALLTSTLHGGQVTDVTVALDDFLVYARGNADTTYNILNNF
jgi:hypothetical protein